MNNVQHLLQSRLSNAVQPVQQPPPYPPVQFSGASQQVQGWPGFPSYAPPVTCLNVPRGAVPSFPTYPNFSAQPPPGFGNPLFANTTPNVLWPHELASAPGLQQNFGVPPSSYAAGSQGVQLYQPPAQFSTAGFGQVQQNACSSFQPQPSKSSRWSDQRTGHQTSHHSSKPRFTVRSGSASASHRQSSASTPPPTFQTAPVVPNLVGVGSATGSPFTATPSFTSLAGTNIPTHLPSNDKVLQAVTLAQQVPSLTGPVVPAAVVNAAHGGTVTCKAVNIGNSSIIHVPSFIEVLDQDVVS